MKVPAGGTEPPRPRGLGGRPDTAAPGLVGVQPRATPPDIPARGSVRDSTGAPPRFPRLGLRLHRAAAAPAACAATVLLAAAVLAVPFAGILRGAVETGGIAGFLTTTRELLSRGSVWRAAGFSFFQAGVSALITILLALPGSYALARYRFAGKRLVEALGLAGFVLPSLLVILAVVAFYGRAGALNSVLGTDWSFVYSPAGIVIAHVVFNLALALRLLAQGWAEFDTRMHEASESLGDTPAGRLVRLAIPFLSGRIAGAFVLVFLYCFLSFSVVLVFGGARFTTLEVEIYREMFVDLSPAGAAALAMLQLAVTGTVSAVLLGIGSRRPIRSGYRTVAPRPIADLPVGQKAAWLVYAAVIVLIAAAPLGALVVRAFRTPDGFGLDAFTQLFSGDSARNTGPTIRQMVRAPLSAVVGQSLRLAVMTGFCSSAAAYLAARMSIRVARSGLDTLMNAPLLVSGVTLSLGYGLLFGHGLPRSLLVVIVQSVMAFPLVFRVFREALRGFSPDLLAAATSLGARPWFRFRTVEFPLLWRSWVQAFAFGAAVSLGDFTAVFTLGAGEVVTVPVMMYRLIGFQHFPASLALGVLYLAGIVVLFVLIEAAAGVPKRRVPHA